MRDSDGLHSRLAKEEAALAATQEQITAAERRIELLRAEIQSAQRQIDASQQQIDKLRQQASSIEKRMSLLREYLAMAEASGAKLETTSPAEADASKTTPGVSITHNTQPNDATEADVGELGEIQFVEPFGPPPAKTTTPRAGVVSFEQLDDETLTLELLPRTQTFEEELLLVMAHHRKAVAPKDVSRVFRRLDYTPKLTGSERILRQRIEAAHHLFEFTGEGRIALTREGREEARRLLQQLL